MAWAGDETFLLAILNFMILYVFLQERDPEDYRLTFRSPPNCLLDECNVFVGIDTNKGNSEYLDITMQGVAGGWLAVGFSFTANMVGIGIYFKS